MASHARAAGGGIASEAATRATSSWASAAVRASREKAPASKRPPLPLCAPMARAGAPISRCTASIGGTEAHTLSESETAEVAVTSCHQNGGSTSNSSSESVKS